MTRVAVTLAILFTAALAQAQSQAYLVKDINETTAPWGSFPNDFLTLGSLSIFTANDSEGNALEVWRSDGTEGGTYRLGEGGRASSPARSPPSSRRCTTSAPARSTSGS